MARNGDSGSRRKRRIPLTNGGSVAVDAADYDRLSQHRWHGIRIGKTTYAKREVGTGPDKKTIYMHREVVDDDAPTVDHRNRRGLDNTRGNLRPASQSQNQSGVKHNRKRKK